MAVLLKETGTCWDLFYVSSVFYKGRTIIIFKKVILIGKGILHIHWKCPYRWACFLLSHQTPGSASPKNSSVLTGNHHLGHNRNATQSYQLSNSFCNTNPTFTGPLLPSVTTEPCTRAKFNTSAPQLLPNHHFWPICERTEAACEILPKQSSCSTFINSYLFWTSFCSGFKLSKTSVFLLSEYLFPTRTWSKFSSLNLKMLVKLPDSIFNCYRFFFQLWKKSKNKHGRSPRNSTEEV